MVNKLYTHARAQKPPMKRVSIDKLKEGFLEYYWLNSIKWIISSLLPYLSLYSASTVYHLASQNLLSTSHNNSVGNQVTLSIMSTIARFVVNWGKREKTNSRHSGLRTRTWNLSTSAECLLTGGQDSISLQARSYKKLRNKTVNIEFHAFIRLLSGIFECELSFNMCKIWKGAEFFKPDCNIRTWKASLRKGRLNAFSPTRDAYNGRRLSN